MPIGGSGGGKSGKGGAKGGAAGKAGAGAAGGKAGAGRPGAGGLGGKSGGMGSKSGGMGGSKSGGGGLGKQSGSKTGGLGGSKTGGFGSKPGGSSSKPGGMMGSKPGGSSAAKPGGFGAKPAAKPGSASKPGGMMGKPGGSKPGGVGAKPGSSSAKPGAAGAKPGSSMGAKPGSSSTAKPGGLGAKTGSNSALGAKSSGSKLGGGLGGAAKTGGLGAKASLGAGGLGAKGVGAASVQSTVRTAVALKTAHDVTRGMAPNKNGQGGFGERGGARGHERDDKLLRNSSQSSALGESGGNSRNIALSQMDRMDITKMSPRELMMLERQYGSGWLKTLAPTQFNRIQNAVGGAALTSNTPTALSSHMDPRLLQAASGIQGTGLMGVPQDSMGDCGPGHFDSALDTPTPTSADANKLQFDAAVLATHPEQIGEGEMEGDEDERIPSDPMKIKLLDAPADQADSTPSPLQPPSLSLPPQPPQASSAPPPEDSSSSASSPGPVSAGTAPKLSVMPVSPLAATQKMVAPPPPPPPPQDSQREFGTIPPQVSQMSAPAYSYESYDSAPYGENLYNQQPGYDPRQDQYHMSAPLLDSGNPEHMGYYHEQPAPFPSRYQQSHKSYYHYFQMNNPGSYNFSKAVQNYDPQSRSSDGTYCYSCVMFLGVLLIGCGIIMVIVELFGLFGTHKNMPLGIAGGGVLALGIIILAGSMLLWRKRRSSVKKKAAHV